MQVLGCEPFSDSRSAAQFVFPVRRSYPLKNKKGQMQAMFCPLTTPTGSTCLVTGGQDGSIRIYDTLNAKISKPINVFQGSWYLTTGHSAAVYDVAWSFDESLLASCDQTGTVIVWKRTKIEASS